MTSGLRQVRPEGNTPTLCDIQTRRVNPRRSHTQSAGRLNHALGLTCEYSSPCRTTEGHPCPSVAPLLPFAELCLHVLQLEPVVAAGKDDVRLHPASVHPTLDSPHSHVQLFGQLSSRQQAHVPSVVVCRGLRIMPVYG
mgnify:CR=1 FL=1